MLEEYDWVVLDIIEDGDCIISIEGTNEGMVPDDDFVESDPEIYQVVYKTQWRNLIPPTAAEPTPEQIRLAMKLATRAPEFMRVMARMNLLQGLFLQLDKMTIEKGYCPVCAKSIYSEVKHDDGCILERGMKIIRRSTL